MDAQVTPVPEKSTDTAEVFRVSLATLGGRRVWCWYWKPRAPGRYSVHFELPSSGVYPRQAEHVPHGPNLCGMWMAIHGLPVDFDPNPNANAKNPPQDPAAWNYWTHGIASPQTSVWRTIYASMVRGLDFLCSRDEVDPQRIMVAGGSQGGGLSLVLAGLDRRVAFAAPAHSGLPRLDWTVLHAPGFWPFGLSAKPADQTTEQFLATLSYFDAANFTPDIACPVVAEVSLLDTVTASGNQICALAHVKPGQLELICDPWTSHASEPRGAALRAAAINRWLQGETPLVRPVK
jgi:cephalosporin-C deacetylase-like acetyl esterase